MRLLQFSEAGRGRVARVCEDGAGAPLARLETAYQLARACVAARRTLAELASAEPVDAPLGYAELLRDGRLLPPLTHPDPAHCLVTGTGLTHLGSAAARDAMHAKLGKADAELTDSMKMFKAGVAGGKTPRTDPGQQPPGVYKGEGGQPRPPGAPPPSPPLPPGHG